jgi:tetratricopeptide (TPR) repeat protein
MKKRTATFILGLTLLCNQSYAQDFKQKFGDLFSKKDTIGQKELLEKWEKAKGDDPELYVAYYNYYVAKSSNDVIAVGNNPKGEKVLQIMSNDSTKKEPAGYIYGDTDYNTELLNKAFNVLDKGIEKYPTRLDMRFGKIYMLGKIENYEKFTEEIIKTIDYSAVIKNQWTWEDSKPLDDPEKVFLGSIQDYILQLYNTENDTLLDNMKMIAEAILKHYPNHIESLSNLSIVYLLKKEYDKALEPLLKAEKIDNKDYIVLNNIAQAYKLKGDSKKAIEYYELTIKYGDDGAKEHAKEEIEKLKAKE